MSIGTLKEYADQESKDILNGQRLLSEREIMIRWNYNPDNKKDFKRGYKKIWELRTGRHKSGALLPTAALDSQHRLYRLRDVMAVEHKLFGGN